MGAHAGAKVTGGYALSATSLLESYVQKVASLATGMVNTIAQVSQVAGSIGSGIASSFGQLFAIFEPSTWKLEGYTPEQATVREFGAFMSGVSRGQGMSRFLSDEGKHPPVVKRLTSIEQVGVLTRLKVALNVRHNRTLTAAGKAPGKPTFEAGYFLAHSYLEFLSLVQEQGLIMLR